MLQHPFINFVTNNDTREFFRARVSKDRSFPLNYKGLLWNPHKSKKKSRFDTDDDPVLYIANQANAAFSETDTSDDFVILSTFKIQETKSVKFLPIGTLSSTFRSNSNHLDFTEESIILTRRKLIECPRHELNSLLIADEFIYNCLMEEDDNYEISSYTANLIFKKHPSVDAISYPSKKLRSAVNYAVKTHGFWDKWMIGAACTLKVRELALGYFGNPP